MAAQALEPGTTIVRRRAFFGLLDAGGLPWATLKAGLWFVVIVMMMAWMPDRALYATVQPTIELGVPLSTFNKSLDVTPINLCPPSNATLPCPAPIGAVLRGSRTRRSWVSRRRAPMPRSSRPASRRC